MTRFKQWPDGPLSPEEDFQRGVDRARKDETERCALLCEQLAAIHKAGARRIRKEGEYTVRVLWPFGKKMTLVRPGYEKQAQVRDAAVHTLEVLAHCIRMGYDPRELERHEHENERMTVVATGVDGDPTLKSLPWWEACCAEDGRV